MPNHVTNELLAAGRIIDSLRSSVSEVDFDLVVPMPDLLRLPDGVDGISAHIIDWAQTALGIVTLESLSKPTPDPAEAFKRGDYGAASLRLEQLNHLRLITEGPWPKDFNDADFELFLRTIRCQKQFGYPSWYEWSVANWGTKWNAYEVKRESDECIRFNTAWSVPFKVIQELSLKFPEERIRIRWADEDFGSNVGDLTIKNGEIVDGHAIENGSIEAQNLALVLLHDGVIPEDMIRTDDGHLAYRDDE